jgi:hypothetical protein
LAALCSALDPDSVPLPEATPLWETFDAIARLAAGAKCRLARRVEESRSWQAHGARSAAEHLGALSGTTTGRARAELESSKALAALPAADAAVANGELSDQQAEAITQAAKADPGAEARLVALAKRRDLRRLREECARTQARAEDEAARAERLRRQRSLRTWTAADGSWNLLAKHTPEVGAQIEAALAPLKEAIFQGARRAGHHEPGEAYGADALAEMARRSVAADDARPGDVPAGHPDHVPATEGVGASSGADARGAAAGDPAAEVTTPARKPARSRRPDTKVIVLISYEALKRGLAEADETCEIAGVGPVSVATVNSLMGDAFGAAIVTDGVDVFTVAHLGRSATAHQRSALEARGYHCEVPGCGATTALEIDHIDDWHKTYRTKLDAMAWLCGVHHTAKTNGGWRLEGPPGERRWVGPGEAGVQPAGPGPDPPPAGAEERQTLFGDPSAA